MVADKLVYDIWSTENMTHLEKHMQKRDKKFNDNSDICRYTSLSKTEWMSVQLKVLIDHEVLVWQVGLHCQYTQMVDVGLWVVQNPLLEEVCLALEWDHVYEIERICDIGDLCVTKHFAVDRIQLAYVIQVNMASTCGVYLTLRFSKYYSSLSEI